MSKATLSLILGDTKTFNISFTDEDGNAIDITGGTVYFTMKEKSSDDDSNALIQKIVTAHTDPINGLTQIKVEPADWGSTKEGQYYYDFQLTTSGGDKYTPLYGRINVIIDITKS